MISATSTAAPKYDKHPSVFFVGVGVGIGIDGDTDTDTDTDGRQAADWFR